jgi:hypothetical protein
VALAENEDGFRAYVSVVDDVTFDGAPWEQLSAVVQATGQHAPVLFVADKEAMGEPYPILVVDLGIGGHRPFRCAATQLWSVDNNLNLANMDWVEFASAVDVDGVYRGFD